MKTDATSLLAVSLHKLISGTILAHTDSRLESAETSALIYIHSAEASKVLVTFLSTRSGLGL